MHEVKPLANSGTDVNGKVGPVAVKYTNTTPAAEVEPASNSTVAANTTTAANATAAANTTATANTTTAANASTAANTTAASNATALAVSKNNVSAAANATATTATLDIVAAPAALTKAEIEAKVEAETEAKWMKKHLEDKEVKAKFDDLRKAVEANMTASNSWRNGVMKHADGSEIVEPEKYDIPMHERKSLPNEAADVNGKVGP